LEIPKIGLFNTKITFSAFFKNIYPRLGINNLKKAFPRVWEGFSSLKWTPFKAGNWGWGN